MKQDLKAKDEAATDDRHLVARALLKNFEGLTVEKKELIAELF